MPSPPCVIRPPFWRCVGNLELRRGYLRSLFRTTPRGDLRVSLGDGFAIRVPSILCCIYFLRCVADVNVFCCSCGVCALCKHSAHSPSPTIAKRCPPRLVSSNLLFWRCVGNLELRRGYLGSLFRTTPRGDLRVSLGDGFAIRVPMGVAYMYLFFVAYIAIYCADRVWFILYVCKIILSLY